MTRPVQGGGDLDEGLHFQFRDQLSTPLRRSFDGRDGIQDAGYEADGDTEMTRRKGEITRDDPKSQIAASRGAPGRKGAGPHEQ